MICSSCKSQLNSHTVGYYVEYKEPFILCNHCYNYFYWHNRNELYRREKEFAESLLKEDTHKPFDLE